MRPIFNPTTEVPDTLVKLVREIEDANRLAVVTPEEIRCLFGTDRPVWTAEKREQYRAARRAMREEICDAE